MPLMKISRDRLLKMEKYKIIDVKESVIADNDADAEKLRNELKAQDLFLVNIMSSPGGGKTTTLLRTIEALGREFNIGVMEADIDSDVDAATVAAAGAKAIQLHTRGMCHLDADMTRDALAQMGAEDVNMCFIENVGNLVCPAEFDTGAVKNVVILSVPEGDDKPLKYPYIFTKCEVALINKCDTLEIFDDFSKTAVEERIHALNPAAKVFFISSINGEGISQWTDWLRIEANRWLKK